jgi:transcriptional regulator with XRE-family HTH domain
MDSMRPDEQSEQIGQKLRELRKARGLSIRALARASGLSANAISMIERGRSSPSVNTLTKMAQVLGVSISDFFQLQSERRDIVFTRWNEGKCEAFQYGRRESLGGESFTGGIEAYVLNLEAGAILHPEEVAYPADVLVFCLRGRMEFQVGGKTFSLAQGDSLLLRSGLAYIGVNQGSAEMSVLLVQSRFEEEKRTSKAQD